ncbi:MAG: hypothetical protein V5A55_14960 [Halovenus sp.]
MADRTTDRFRVLIGSEEYADHLLDIADVQLDEKREELEETLLAVTDDQSKEELEELEELTALIEVSRSLGWGVPGELMCSHSSKWYGADLMSLSEYAAERGVDEIDFDSDAPEGMCSYCWSNTREMLAKQAELEQKGVADRIGTVGYRLRWKQKGRARQEWYDIVVRPETTMAELDKLVCRFSTLDDFHLRMYGLEDEYLDSSIKVVPDHQHSNPSDTPASEITIAEVAKQATLWEGDRLSLVYDFGTPSHYYCIVKEVYELDELDSLFADTELIAETETAAIVGQQRL